MDQRNRTDLTCILDEICNKINSVSDKFHLRAGLFKEANCDKDLSEVSLGNT